MRMAQARGSGRGEYAVAMSEPTALPLAAPMIVPRSLISAHANVSKTAMSPASATKRGRVNTNSQAYVTRRYPATATSS
jgi:hypothetical protein